MDAVAAKAMAITREAGAAGDVNDASDEPAAPGLGDQPDLDCGAAAPQRDQATRPPAARAMAVHDRGSEGRRRTDRTDLGMCSGSASERHLGRAFGQRRSACHERSRKRQRDLAGPMTAPPRLQPQPEPSSEVRSHARSTLNQQHQRLKPHPCSRRHETDSAEPRIERVVVRPDQTAAAADEAPAQPQRKGWWQRQFGGE